MIKGSAIMIFPGAFNLDPNTVFMNHGSVGVLSNPVYDEQVRYQRLMQEQPLRFFRSHLPPLLEENRSCLADFLNWSSENLIFDFNATAALNIAIRSLPLSNNDEVLLTNMEYEPLLSCWRYHQQQIGYSTRIAEIPRYVDHPQACIDAIERCITKKTRVLYFSHVTSPTGLILPAKEITKMARERGIIVVIDGAHVPGHIPLDLTAIQADMYVANLHKWLGTPISTAFLAVAPALQDRLIPNIITWGFDHIYGSMNAFQSRFYSQGTRDYIPFLCIKQAVAFIQKLHDAGLFEYGHVLVSQIMRLLHDRYGFPYFYPPESELYGMMAAVAIKPEHTTGLEEQLSNDDNIAIVVGVQNGIGSMRFTGYAYNHPSEHDRLLHALDKHRSRWEP